MTDPTTITPETAATLSGRELEIALDWWVRGDDGSAGENQTRLFLAMLGFTASTHTLAGDAWRYGHRHGYPRLWMDREGQPWQAALEAHVSAYRADPTPLDNDRAVELLKQYQLHVCFSPPQYRGRWFAWGLVGNGDSAHGSTFAEAVGRAAVVKACRERQTAPQ